jgi:hypothetical protein
VPLAEVCARRATALLTPVVTIYAPVLHRRQQKTRLNGILKNPSKSLRLTAEILTPKVDKSSR